MAYSMTGFGQFELTDGQHTVSVELKSVNHRFLDIAMKLPRQYSALEEPIRKVISERLTRGHIDVYLVIKSITPRPKAIQIDTELALGYRNALQGLSEAVGIALNPGRFFDVLVKNPDILRVEDVPEDVSTLVDSVSSAVSGALDKLVEMRTAEGVSLVNDLKGRIQVLRGLVAAIEDRAPNVVDDYRKRLNDRLSEILGDIQVDPNRLAAEVALFSDRASITEELVRLASHFDQFEQAMESVGSMGRRLDFLVQEMFREVNTIGSKANDLVISSHVVSAKTELEKVREQVQNIE